MSKFSLIKSIEAKKLNQRTLIPLTDPEVTIPFGAIIDNITADRDMDRFTYNGEPYRCPHERLAPAMVPAGAAAAAAPAAAAAQPAAQPAEQPVPVKGELVWEQLDSNWGSFLRARVPGGWLVAGGAGLVFYPDAGHAWDGTSAA